MSPLLWILGIEFTQHSQRKKKLFKQFTHEKIAATEKNIVLKTNYVVSYVDRASVYTTLVLDI